MVIRTLQSIAFFAKCGYIFIMPLLRNISSISQGLSLAGHGAGARRGDWALKVVESRNVGEAGLVSVEELRRVSVDWNSRSERHLLRPYDVLVTARAGSIEAALVRPDVSRMVAGITLLVVRANDPGTGMGHWIWYFLTSKFGRAEMNRRLVVTATLRVLSASSLGEIEVPVPRLPELERLARLVETSEAAYQSALDAAKLRRDTLKDSLIQEVIDRDTGHRD